MIDIGELGDNVAILNCCHGQVVQGLSDVDGRFGAVEIILRRIHLVLFLYIVILCVKKLFEMHPCFIVLWFLAPLLACLIVVPCGTYGMIRRLQDLFCCESNVTIGGILYSVVDSLKVYDDWLRGVDRLVHLFFALFDVRWCNLPIPIKKMIE